MASVVSIIPIVLLFVLMLGFKMAGHKSALLTLVVTVLLALFAASPLGMIAPEHAEDSVIALTGWAVLEGILKAVFPILIIILMAIYSYNILVESKQIEVIKKQFTSITDDKGLLVLLLVWGFGGLLEGMAGFGTAVAIPAKSIIWLLFKRMFSAQTGAELLKAILKTILVGSVTGFFLWHHWPQMMRLMAESPITAMGNAMDLVGLCALLVVLGVIPMVGFDVFFQIFSHLKKLRMSRQDIRDEFKQSEGDPHVKGRIRQMQRAAARRRMMADVPKADVIVNNPTHYSVALQYDENKMSAPKVVAKGAGLVALRIREIGAENNVPTLEAPPLARALYRHAEIGQQIPGQLYAAVAEVLAWVWQLKRWRLAGGQRPVQPTHLPVPEALDFINEKPTHE